MRVPPLGWIVDAWMPTVLSIANAKRPSAPAEAVQKMLRAALQQIVQGSSGPLFPVALYYLPRVPFTVAAGFRVSPRDPRRERGRDQVINDDLDSLLSTVALLSIDPRARRLRCCDECDRFFFSRADHRREHSFCSDECRRAYDLAHRDPEKLRIYMQEYRKVRRRNAKKKR